MPILHPVPADDFASMDDDALAAAVSTLAAHIHAATCKFLPHLTVIPTTFDGDSYDT